MASLNKIMLMGRVGRVDIKTFGESKLATITLATTESRKDRNGDWQEETSWHNLVVYGNTVQRVERTVQKGALLFVEGRIRYRKYTDRDGNERDSTEIVVTSFESVDARNGNNKRRERENEESEF